MAIYNSSWSGAQIDSSVQKIIANSAPANKVLTSDGNGGSSWESPSGNYTGETGVYVNNTTKKIGLSDRAVPVVKLARAEGVGKKYLTSTSSSDAEWSDLSVDVNEIDTSAGTPGQVLTIDSNGYADWVNPSATGELYLVTLLFTLNLGTKEMIFCASVYSTSAINTTDINAVTSFLDNKYHNAMLPITGTVYDSSTGDIFVASHIAVLGPTTCTALYRIANGTNAGVALSAMYVTASSFRIV